MKKQSKTIIIVSIMVVVAGLTIYVVERTTAAKKGYDNNLGIDPYE